MSSPRMKKYSSGSITLESIKISHLSLKFDIFIDSTSLGFDRESSVLVSSLEESLFPIGSSFVELLDGESSPTEQC